MHCQANASPEISGLPSHLANLDDTSEESRAWYVAYTESRLEQLACTNLQLQGFLTYLPMYQAGSQRPRKSASAASDKAAARQEPMFPRYLFFKPATDKQSISSVRSTRGVRAVVRFGAYFAQVQPETLAAIRRHEEHGPPKASSSSMLLERGSRVKLSDPALNGLEGLVHSASAQRVIVLMEILGRQTRVKLQPHQLEPT